MRSFLLFIHSPHILALLHLSQETHGFEIPGLTVSLLLLMLRLGRFLVILVHQANIGSQSVFSWLLSGLLTFIAIALLVDRRQIARRLVHLY